MLGLRQNLRLLGTVACCRSIGHWPEGVGVKKFPCSLLVGQAGGVMFGGRAAIADRYGTGVYGGRRPGLDIPRPYAAAVAWDDFRLLDRKASHAPLVYEVISFRRGHDPSGCTWSAGPVPAT